MTGFSGSATRRMSVPTSRSQDETPVGTTLLTEASPNQGFGSKNIYNTISRTMH